MNNYIIPACIYFAVISLIAVIMTVHDKKAAKHHKWRLSEASLLIAGLAGGALAELITMKIIRHKTKHIKFMLGLPAEIVLQILVICLIVCK